MWEMALQDPHLIRLGDYLAHVEGEDEMSRQEQQGRDRWDVEDSFMEDPWISDLKIIKVVNPSLYTKPFVLLWNNKSKDHSDCPLYKVLHGAVQINNKVEGNTRPKVPGLSESKGHTDITSFKAWEEWEKEGRLYLDGVFKWKQHRGIKAKGKGKPGDQNDKKSYSLGDTGKSKPKTLKPQSSHSHTSTHHCKEQINNIVKKVLLSSYKPKRKEEKTHHLPITPNSARTPVWRGSSEVPSEVPQARDTRRKPTWRSKLGMVHLRADITRQQRKIVSTITSQFS